MSARRQGFTLAEMAVTIAIVGMTLVALVQTLNQSLVKSGYTRNLKIARELGLLTLGRLEAGLYIDELEDHMEGDYGDDEYPEFTWEVALEDVEFYDEELTDSEKYDSWADEEDDEDDDAASSEPWVVARVKVRFPAPADVKGDLVLERWLTREFVYGPEEEDE